MSIKNVEVVVRTATRKKSRNKCKYKRKRIKHKGEAKNFIKKRIRKVGSKEEVKYE
jgi:hypothetical protein